MGNKKKSKKSAVAKEKEQETQNAQPEQPEVPKAGPSSTTPPPSSPSPEAPAQEPTPVTEEDPIKGAEKIKEKGNVAFKASKFQEAIEHYTTAIGMNPSEPAFLTNRAAAYIAVKKFRPALEDCQQAAVLQAASPAAKTLLRLARCQFALGSATAASSTLKTVLELDPKNPAATQLKSKISELESHLKRFEQAKSKKDWGMARLALEKCFQAIEAEGDEIPSEWNTWKIELELSKGNIDGANSVANEALRTNPNSPEILTLRGLVLFLNGKLPQAVQHVSQALRFDPSYAPAQRLRKRTKEVERLKNEGNQFFKSSKLEEAISKYTEALDLVGSEEEEGKGGNIRATLLSNRATTLVKLQRHQEALEDVDISIELVPKSFKALRTRARIHLALDNLDKAVMDFKSAIMEAQKDGSSSDADVRALGNELKKAEAALKRSKTKDYYKILGLQRDCTEIEIKKAYRRESLKHHPDKGGDEEKFKLVVEAHAVLSDPARRERYDMGEDEDGMTDSGGMGGMHGMSQADIASLFAQFGGGGFGNSGFGGGRHPGGFSFSFG
ncbi:TPR-like protein [Marasmius fiardii PR-910]|nr:TPR-like protein [Marasmius fiardii PR-910]